MRDNVLTGGEDSSNHLMIAALITIAVLVHGAIEE